MKKLLAILMTLLLLCGAAFAETPDVTGFWYAPLDAEGTVILVVQLEADGTYNLAINADVTLGTWAWRTENEIVLTSDAGSETIIDVGVNGLMLEYGDTAYQLAQRSVLLIDTDAPLADFAGEWYAESIILNDRLVDMARLDSECTIGIMGENLTVHNLLGSTLLDGNLLPLTDYGNGLHGVRVQTGENITLFEVGMLTDGRLLFVTAYQESELDFVMNRAAESSIEE